jgi:selenide, water dikinase
MVPGGTGRNLDFVGDALVGATDAQQALLADPQTSGGLLVAVPPGQTFAMPGSVIIGRVVAGPSGQIRLT